MKNTNNFVPTGYSKVIISQIISPNEPVFAVFNDPQDGEIVVQLVVVWAVLNFYSTIKHELPELVKTLVRGLTELPDSPYLTDNALWDDNFIGYFRPNLSTLNYQTEPRLLSMVEDYKRRHKDVRRERDSREPEKEMPPSENTTNNIIAPGSNFWKGKLPGHPEWAG